MYERPRVNLKIKQGSTFPFTHDSQYVTSILLTRQRKSTLTGGLSDGK